MKYKVGDKLKQKEGYLTIILTGHQKIYKPNKFEWYSFIYHDREVVGVISLKELNSDFRTIKEIRDNKLNKLLNG